MMTGWTFDFRTHPIGGAFQFLSAIIARAFQIFGVIAHKLTPLVFDPPACNPHAKAI